MSQSQGFTEGELVENIHKLINLRIDKEALVRPSREIVYQIYSVFLDHLHPAWRDGEPGYDPQEESETVQLWVWIRRILRRYALDIEFNGHDIVTPTRRRTNTFIVALLMFKAEFDVKSEEKTTREAALAEEREENEKLDRMIAAAQTRRNDLAERVGKKRRKAEMKKMLDDKRMELQDHQKIANEIEERGKKLKAELLAKEELLLGKMNQLEKDKEKIRRYKLARERKLEDLRTEEEIAKQEHILETLRIKNTIALKQKQAKIQMLTDDNLDRIQQIKQEIDKGRDKIEQEKKEMLKYDSEVKEFEEKIKALIDRANKQLETFKDRYEKSMQASEQGKITLKNVRTKMNLLIGNPSCAGDEISPDTENHNNVTYILASKIDKAH